MQVCSYARTSYLCWHRCQKLRKIGKDLASYLCPSTVESNSVGETYSLGMKRTSFSGSGWKPIFWLQLHLLFKVQVFVNKILFSFGTILNGSIPETWFTGDSNNVEHPDMLSFSYIDRYSFFVSYLLFHADQTPCYRNYIFKFLENVEILPF